MSEMMDELSILRKEIKEYKNGIKVMKLVSEELRY